MADQTIHEALGVTFSDGEPIPALLDFEGRGRRIARKWFPGDTLAENYCVAAIREFVVSQPEGLDLPGQMQLREEEPETELHRQLRESIALQRGEFPRLSQITARPNVSAMERIVSEMKATYPTTYTATEHREALDSLRDALGYVDPAESEQRETAEDRDDRLTHEAFDREAVERSEG